MNNKLSKKDSVYGLPVKAYLNNIRRISTNIQKNIEFIFVLKGELNIVINNKSYKLTETDVLLINNGDVYEINGIKENLVLLLHIDYDFFNKVAKKGESLYLCNSCLDKDKNYESIRKILVKIMLEYSKREDSYELQIMSLLYKLIYLLNKNFLIIDSNKTCSLEVQSNKYNERINNILKYIKQNYNQQISLCDVAKSQYLTPEYLSKFFKTQMNITFTKYLNEFRLAQAVKELIQTDNSVTKIAMQNGFPNLAAFNKIFKEKFNVTPAEYRNQIRKKQTFIDESEKLYSETINVEYDKAIEHLEEYINVDEELNIKDKEKDSMISNNIVVDVNTVKGEQINHSWNNMINLGYAPDGLRFDFQQHLIEIQNTLKFKYARFQGIFSDEMLFDTDQNERDFEYNFTKIDKLIDFLYSIEMKPFIELGNKAKVLNLTPDKILYYKNPSINNGGKEYFNLLKKFVEHCISRYGIDEVSQWYFEIWKEGDKNYVIWDGNFSKYIDFFENCYNVIKQLVPNAKVGGPGMNPETNLNFMPELLKQWEKREVRPDFFSVVLYPYDIVEEKKSDIENNLLRLISSTDRDFHKFYLDKVLKILKASGSLIPEVHVTEWNCSISHRHPANDTTFKGSYIIKSVIDTLDITNSFGYWFCSDLSGELKDSKTLLYGDMGLISKDGIRKPGFYAFWMLKKLGNVLVGKGDGYVITRKSSYKYEIITYNYKHFDYFYCLNEEISVSIDRYYSIFEDYQNLYLNIYLKGIRSGHYRVKKYTLNRRHGSILDEWIKMNGINNLRKDEINYLKQICVPKQTIFYVECKDELKIESILEPHEVNLYEIEYEYK